MSSAIVVGAGPNGLTAAAILARAGVEVTVLEAAEEIGGGTRSSELLGEGLVSDHCSAFHPLAANSPAFASLGLERRGLEWLHPEVELAHPLDGGTAAVMLRSLDATADGLGAAGRRWRAAFGRPARDFDALNAGDLVRPVLHPPRHPVKLVRFGLRTLLPATALGRMLGSDEAAALWGGVAAHAYTPLSGPFSSAVGMALVCAGHAYGWPVAKGGSGAIARALAAVIAEHGGRVETGVTVRSVAELGEADAVVLDLSPAAAAELAAERLPARVGRAFRRYRHGPGAFKLDLAVEGGVPWAAEVCRRAGTVHAAGSLAEIARGEAEVNRGRMPASPFVLVGQQHVADPSRSRGDVQPVWAYAHVPAGYAGDATEAILAQIERFAPGLRERITEIVATTPADFEAQNPNWPGGDIITGANTPRQTLFRPRLALDPYRCAPGLYICSAATPPGPGAHGMCGANAAESVLRGLG